METSGWMENEDGEEFDLILFNVHMVILYSAHSCLIRNPTGNLGEGGTTFYIIN